jgi:uncharacterized membrane protein
MNPSEAESRNGIKPLALFLVGYAAVLLLLLARIPLWLDEIAAMNVLVQPDMRALIDSLRTMTGGTPFPYVTSAWMVRLLGPTAFAARLCSGLSSIAACAGVYFLAGRLHVKWPLIAVVIFALCPLQFRYAMEARPYEMALAFSIWSTVAFLKLADQAEIDARRNIFIYGPSYCALVMLAGSTMVYALFVPGAHAMWLMATSKGWKVPRAVLGICAVAMALAILSLVPWYLLFRADWAANSLQQHVTPVTFSVVKVVLHELTGSGYVGTVLLTLGVALAFMRHSEDRTGLATFFAVYALVPALLIPVADVVFYYFFAMRQMIFILPPLFVLFTVGALHSGRGIGRCLLIAITITFLYGDVNWMTRPHEDWDAAGAAATAVLADPNACAIVIPELNGSAFLFAHPNLRARACSDFKKTMVLAISPYDSDEALKSAQEKLVDRGYTKKSEQSFAGPRVEVYVSR